MLDLVAAGLGLGHLIVVAILVAMAALLTWLLCIALGVVWAIQSGANAYAVLACAIAFHVGAIGLGVAFINHRQRALGARIVRHLFSE
jgi:uncharacterized RDD family membrane protein YckC